MRLGIGELLFIFCIVLILFGPAKLPQLGKSMGQAIRNFKTGMESIDSTDDNPSEDEE
ncbi:MAG: twin-arginine translocase TatA/TatE family subunit [Butyricicoccus sp.]